MEHVAVVGLLIVAAWVLVLIVLEFYDEDEQPRERRGSSFEWIAYDRRLDVTSAQILRRYRCSRCRLHRLFFITRSRAPPLVMNDPDGLHE